MKHKKKDNYFNKQYLSMIFLVENKCKNFYLKFI